MTRIIIRGAAEIEIVLPEGVEPPTVSAAESRHPSVTTRSAASAANPIETGIPVSSESPARPAGERPGTAGNEPGLAPLAAEAAEQPTATVAAVGGSETVASSGSAPPEVTLTVLDEPTVAALLADVGKRVLAAVENPPAPEVDLPAELPLRRPVEEDTLDFPAILDRRAGRAS